MAKGGFLSNFAYGFEQTAKPILDAEGKANAEADARIREKVASVEPMAELNRRDEENKTAATIALMKQRQANEGNMLSTASTALQADHAALTGSPAPSGVAAPAPTITTPSMAPVTNGANPFTPTDTSTNTAPAPTVTPAPVDHFALSNEYKVLEAKAQQAGDKEGAEHWKTMSDLHKNQADHELAVKKTEPVPNKSAEGINAVEEISKETENNIKAGGDSVYLPSELSQSTADPKIANFERKMAQTVHAPLLQASMAYHRQLDPTKPEEEVYGLAKADTLAPSVDIATITAGDPKITPARKQAAYEDLKTYMDTTYGDKVGAMIHSDPNLKKVFTSHLMQTMAAIRNTKVAPVAQPTTQDNTD